MVHTTIPELEPNVTNALKKTRFGTLFQKDTWDLFSSLILSMKLATHKQIPFKAYRDSFLGHEAIRNLGSLKFIRSPDTRDLSNLIPLSIHTAKIPEGSALGVMQQFLDGALIKDATSKSHALYFNKKTIYTPTSKGFYIIEEFIRKCDLESEADHLVAALSSQPTPRLVLCHLQRRIEDDELVMVPQPVIFNLFREFAGLRPNYGYRGLTGVILLATSQRTSLLKGLFLNGAFPLEGKISAVKTTHCIETPRIIHWLCENTVISCPQEAAEVAAYFVLSGLIALITDRATRTNGATAFTVTGPRSRRSSSPPPTAEFRYSHHGIYAITDQGNLLAGWINGQDPSMLFIGELLASTSIRDQDAEPPSQEPADRANAARFKKFVVDPAILVLFRQFLSERRREYDLSFWLDVEDFKAEFEKASKAAATPNRSDSPPVAGSSKTPLESPPQTDLPHESLNNRPFLIYNTYLAPSSECKLSFDIGDELREELQRSLEHCVEYLTNKALITETGYSASTTLEIDQLAIIIWMYERIQKQVFTRLSDQCIPKFLKWPRFITSRIAKLNSIEEEAPGQPGKKAAEPDPLGPQPSSQTSKKAAEPDPFSDVNEISEENR